MELPDLIASEQYHQHTRAATVAWLLVLAVRMDCRDDGNRIRDRKGIAVNGGIRLYAQKRQAAIC